MYMMLNHTESLGLILLCFMLFDVIILKSVVWNVLHSINLTRYQYQRYRLQIIIVVQMTCSLTLDILPIFGIQVTQTMLN